MIKYKKRNYRINFTDAGGIKNFLHSIAHISEFFSEMEESDSEMEESDSEMEDSFDEMEESFSEIQEAGCWLGVSEYKKW